MAAKTKAVIIRDIDNKIVTNGNIKALDTNAILKDILDCQELNTSVDVFNFKGKDLASAPADSGRLNYSIRGIVGSFANITFKISVDKDGVQIFDFPSDNKELVKFINPIIDSAQSNQLSFLVKVGPPSESSTSIPDFRIANLNLLIAEKGFTFRIKCFNMGAVGGNSILNKGDIIFTSIAIHCPVF
ncbi:hypothetical protein [Flavobacterium sp.]|uniref:hypothetical protein n=1 Tax=Flavobacterium sp. TaxID=239 RepID=UPI003D6B42BF